MANVERNAPGCARARSSRVEVGPRGRCAKALAAALGLLLAASSLPVGADDSIAAAEALFHEGRRLLEAGEIPAACAKLAESQRLDPSPGTLLNLARCHRKQGQTATAWAEYLAAARSARAQNRSELEQEARARASELETELSYLTVRTSKGVSGLEVRRNGVILDAASLGARIPVDPGEHVIVASAPGRRAWTGRAVVGAARDERVVAVPVLEATAPSGAASRPDAANAASADSSGRSPVLGLAVGGAGLAFAAAGAAFGGAALASYSGAESKCPTHVGCSAAAMDQRRQADTFATLANVGIIAGTAGIGAGVVLLLVSRGSPPAKASPAFALGVGPPGGVGASIRVLVP